MHNVEPYLGEVLYNAMGPKLWDCTVKITNPILREVSWIWKLLFFDAICISIWLIISPGLMQPILAYLLDLLWPQQALILILIIEFFVHTVLSHALIDFGTKIVAEKNLDTFWLGLKVTWFRDVLLVSSNLPKTTAKLLKDFWPSLTHWPAPPQKN